MSNDTPQLPLFTIVRDDLPPIVPITNKRTKDLTGQRFGRLVALGFVGRDKNNRAMWLCQCDCGTRFATLSNSLIAGRTRSCGCYMREITAQRNFRHGSAGSPEYIVWSGMKARCENPNELSYKDYGARGIKVCARWRNSFEDFFADMGPKPGTEYSIERIDNNGNYEPNNCRWATRQEQNDNSRHNRKIEFQGQNLTISQWARKVGISPRALFHRINTGWSTERALTTPAEQHSLEFRGERLTIVGWARKTGVSARTIRYRIARGWTIEEALTKMEKRYQRR